MSKLFEKTWVQYVFPAFLGVLSAFFYEIFVYPNDFAPAGINGIATMLQYIFDFRVGYTVLIINIPLLLYAAKVVKRSFSIKTAIFTVFFSLSGILFRNVDFSAYAFNATDAGEGIMAAIASGVIGGAVHSFSIRMGGSMGGTDVLAAVVHEKNPEYNMVWVSFTMGVMVAFISFFVYGRQYVAVILCIINNFVSSSLSDFILKGLQSAVKFEVFTDRPEELAQELMTKLSHGCTVLKGQGMYSRNEVSLLICVVNKNQSVEFEKIIKNYPDTFAIRATINATYGKFLKVRR